MHHIRVCKGSFGLGKVSSINCHLYLIEVHGLKRQVLLCNEYPV